MSKQNTPAFSTLLNLVSPVITHGAHIVPLNCLTQLDQSRNEDRYIVDEWMMPNGSWTYAAIFDGQYWCTSHLVCREVIAVVSVYCRTRWLGSSGFCSEGAIANSQDFPHLRA